MGLQRVRHNWATFTNIYSGFKTGPKFYDILPTNRLSLCPLSLKQWACDCLTGSICWDDTLWLPRICHKGLAISLVKHLLLEPSASRYIIQSYDSALQLRDSNERSLPAISNEALDLKGRLSWLLQISPFASQIALSDHQWHDVEISPHI